MPHADGKLRVNLPPDPNPRPLKFKPPAGSWDTHFHLFGPPQRFPYVEDRRYTPPAAPLEHYIGLMNLLGIERGVLVHPMVHGLENRVTLDALQRTDGRLRNITGIYMPGRDSHRWLDILGGGAAFFALLGVVGHGTLRIFGNRKGGK